MKKKTTFIEFLEMRKINKILVELPEKLLTEATRKSVGNYTARRDQPHFDGDEYHAHVKIKGYEVAWGKSGKRRHPNKFPVTIPKNAKKAIAKVLDVDISILESYKIFDPELKEDVFLIEMVISNI